MMRIQKRMIAALSCVAFTAQAVTVSPNVTRLNSIGINTAPVSDAAAFIMATPAQQDGKLCVGSSGSTTANAFCVTQWAVDGDVTLVNYANAGTSFRDDTSFYLISASSNLLLTPTLYQAQASNLNLGSTTAGSVLNVGSSTSTIHLAGTAMDYNGVNITVSSGTPTLTATTGFTTTPTVTATYQKIGRQVCLQIPAFSAVSNSTAAWFLSGMVSFTWSAAGDLTLFAKVLDNGAEVDGYITMNSTTNRVNFFKSGGAAWTASGNKGLSKPLNYCYLSN